MLSFPMWWLSARLAPPARSNPTAFQAVSFEQVDLSALWGRMPSCARLLTAPVGCPGAALQGGLTTRRRLTACPTSHLQATFSRPRILPASAGSRLNEGWRVTFRLEGGDAYDVDLEDYY
jgi:hypothetical protein